MATLTVNGSSRLSPSEQRTILAALEECTNALAIYQNTLQKPPKRIVDVSIDCILPSIEESETSSEHLSPDAAASIEDMKKKTAYIKLYEDSLYLTGVLESLKKEIRDSGTFEVLTKEVERIEAREKEEELLREETEKFQKLAEDLRKTLADEKLANDEEKKKLLSQLFEAERRAEKSKLIDDVEARYIEAWESARCSQHLLLHDAEVQKLEKKLNDYRTRERNERRVHEELTTFLTRQMTSIEEQTEEWQQRYDREKKMYERSIRKVRNEIEARRKELEELKQEYHSNQKFIDWCLAENEARRRQEEEEERRRRSTIRIQAWWRGVMVRRKLGPYRPEEKKKKRTAKTKK